MSRKNNNKVTLARLDERIKNVQNSVDEIKVMISNIKGCIDEDRIEIMKIKTRFSDHLKTHKEGVKWAMWIPSLVAVVIAFISLIR